MHRAKNLPSETITSKLMTKTEEEDQWGKMIDGAGTRKVQNKNDEENCPGG